MKNRFKICTILLLLTLTSCVKEQKEDLDSKIVNQVILSYCNSDSARFLNNSQGSFSYEKISSDSIILFYSKIGFGIYTNDQCSYIDSLPITPIGENAILFETVYSGPN